jgi:hypothetical protein
MDIKIYSNGVEKNNGQATMDLVFISSSSPFEFVLIVSIWCNLSNICRITSEGRNRNCFSFRSHPYGYALSEPEEVKKPRNDMPNTAERMDPARIAILA